jgi:hypothetical protein
MIQKSLLLTTGNPSRIKIKRMKKIESCLKDVLCYFKQKNVQKSSTEYNDQVFGLQDELVKIELIVW